MSLWSNLNADQFVYRACADGKRSSERAPISGNEILTKHFTSINGKCTCMYNFNTFRKQKTTVRLVIMSYLLLRYGPFKFDVENKRRRTYAKILFSIDLCQNRYVAENLITGFYLYRSSINRVNSFLAFIAM